MTGNLSTPATQHIDVMPDYGCHPLWVTAGSGVRTNIDPYRLPIPAALAGDRSRCTTTAYANAWCFRPALVPGYTADGYCSLNTGGTCRTNRASGRP